LIPPDIDILELGIITVAGHYDLLPIDTDDKPLWSSTTSLIVTAEQAEQQRRLLIRAYRALHALIREAAELEASITEWSRRGVTHPVFGMLRLTTIEVWKMMRRTNEPLLEKDLDRLHAEVARHVAAKIRAHAR
jgi:hypothetical protein